MNLTQKRTLARQLATLAAQLTTDPQAAETLLLLAANLDQAWTATSGFSGRFGSDYAPAGRNP